MAKGTERWLDGPLLRTYGISVLPTLTVSSKLTTVRGLTMQEPPIPTFRGTKKKTKSGGGSNEFVFKYMQHIVAQLLTDFYKVDIGKGEVQQGLARFHYEFIKSSLIKLDL